jgi:prephenate dehydratase
MKHQAGVFYMGIKIYNSLTTYIKNELNNHTRFVPLKKKFLCENSFYSLEEFYNFLRHKYLKLFFILVEVLYIVVLHNTA